MLTAIHSVLESPVRASLGGILIPALYLVDKRLIYVKG